MARPSKKFPKYYLSTDANEGYFKIIYIFNSETFADLSYWGCEGKGFCGMYSLSNDKFTVTLILDKKRYLHTDFIEVKKEAIKAYEEIFIKYLDSIGSKKAIKINI